MTHAALDMDPRSAFRDADNALQALRDYARIANDAGDAAFREDWPGLERAWRQWAAWNA